MHIEEWLTPKHTLRFRKNGKFRVLVLSDAHIERPIAPETVACIETTIAKADPDLVLFNGDNNTAPASVDDLRENVTRMTAYCEKHSILWAHTFGNHDDQCPKDGKPLSKETQEVVYESFPMCVSKRGEPSIHGVGNYVLPVRAADSEKILFNIFALDSGNYYNDIHPGLNAQVGMTPNPIHNDKPFGYIPFSQIAWYYATSEALEAYNGDKIPAMMCFHIPLCEYNLLDQNREALGVQGVKQEPIASSELNSGLFTAALDRGDVRLFVAGHDHINDLCGTYCGISLAYDGSVGYQVYYKENTLGGRVVEIDAQNPSQIRTYMCYYKS